MKGDMEAVIFPTVPFCMGCVLKIRWQEGGCVIF